LTQAINVVAPERRRIDVASPDGVMDFSPDGVMIVSRPAPALFHR
jgi:hypothetical protein